MDNPTDKPVSDTPEGTGSDQESSVTGLSDLAHEEIDEKPESKAAEPAAPIVPADMPAFGLAPEPEPAPKEPEWQPPPMTETFWQKMAPQSHTKTIVIVGGLVLALAGAAVAAVVVLRQPPPPEEGGTAVATAETPPAKTKAQPATTTPAKAETPPPAPSAEESEDAGATRPAKTTKPRTRKRRKAPREKSEETPAPPAETPAEPDPAPAPAPAAGGEPLTAKDIKLGVKQNMSKVKGCIKAAKQAGVLAPGKHTLTLDWAIAPSGAVTDAHVRGPSEVVNTSLAKCFSGAMRRWKFRPSPKGAPVKNFPFGPFNLK